MKLREGLFAGKRQPVEDDSESTTSRRCCGKKCSKWVVLLSVVAVSGLVFLAVDESSYKHNEGKPEGVSDEEWDVLEEQLEAAQDVIDDRKGWPAQCFAGAPAADLSSAAVSVAAGNCTAEVEALCPVQFANSTANGLQGILELQRCVSASLLDLSPECSQVFDLAPVRAFYPSGLKNEQLVRAAVDACKDSAKDFCRAETRHLDLWDEDEPLNLCQVNDIAVCLLAEAAAAPTAGEDQVSQQCVAAIAALGVEVPVGFQRATFVNARGMRYGNDHHKAWKIAGWTILAVALFYGGSKTYKHFRGNKRDSESESRDTDSKVQPQGGPETNV